MNKVIKNRAVKFHFSLNRFRDLSLLQIVLSSNSKILFFHYVTSGIALSYQLEHIPMYTSNKKVFFVNSKTDIHHILKSNF